MCLNMEVLNDYFLDVSYFTQLSICYKNKNKFKKEANRT